MCPECDDTGVIECLECEGPSQEITVDYVDCEYCEGEGEVECPSCS